MSKDENDAYLKRANEVYAAARIKIDGRANPQLVPLDAKMAFFFRTYAREHNGYRRRLLEVLSPEEDAILATFAQDHTALKVKQSKEHSKSYVDNICSVAEHMEPIALAHALEAHEQKYRDVSMSTYNAVLKKLSKKSASAVKAFIEENIKPSTTRIDPLVMATTDPEFFLDQVIGECRAIAAGTVMPPPPEFDEPSKQNPSDSPSAFGTKKLP